MCCNKCLLTLSCRSLTKKLKEHENPLNKIYFFAWNESRDQEEIKKLLKVLT